MSITINDGDYKEGDVVKSIKTTTELGYGTKDFPQRKIIKNNFLL